MLDIDVVLTLTLDTDFIYMSKQGVKQAKKGNILLISQNNANIWHTEEKHVKRSYIALHDTKCFTVPKSLKHLKPHLKIIKREV